MSVIEPGRSVRGEGQAPSGSIAKDSFDDALGFMAAHPPSPVRERLPYDYLLPAERHGRQESELGDSAGDVVPSGPGASIDGSGGPLVRAAAELREGSTTAVELVRRSFAAIDERNEQLVALVEVRRERALAEAEQMDELAARGEFVGPLHGIPITVKDVIDVAGLPTRCASAAFEDHPEQDATAVARLRAAGAIVLGKAATHEFALGVTSPQSRNPVDPTRIPGGSRGGSAVAVATGMGLASLGTDTRASIRVPAALSGVVGFKPTYGRVPTTGVVSLAWTMDHVGPLASTVVDAATVMDVLLDNGTSLASVPAEVEGLRIGVVTAGFADAPEAVVSVVEHCVDALGDVGAKVGDAPVPDATDLTTANSAGLIVSRVEAATFHRSLGLDLDLYWEEVGDQLRAAQEIAGVDYLDAQRVRAQLADRLLAAFEHHDVLVMPTSPVTAPRSDDFARYLMLLSRNAIPWSFVGFPVISVPCGFVEGLPVGLQVIAPPDREDLLVAVGRTIESVR